MKIRNDILSEETRQRNERVRQKLLERYPRSKKGFWKIRGEDSNCDLGGPHHMPELCVVESTYEEAVDYALTLSGFWQWGAGGDITEVVIKKPMALKKRAALEKELETLKARVKEIEEEL